MKKIHILFHDAGGGHRNAAVALKTIMDQQRRPGRSSWFNFRSSPTSWTYSADSPASASRSSTTSAAKRMDTGRRLSPANPPSYDSAFPRAAGQAARRSFGAKSPPTCSFPSYPTSIARIAESWTKVYPGRPFVTMITDLADFPPRFWIEPIKEQYVICRHPACRRAGQSAWPRRRPHLSRPPA